MITIRIHFQVLTYYVDELSYTFDLPTYLHCKYRLTYVLPGYWKHYVVPFSLRRKQKDVEKASDDLEDWPLLPFHRWARTRLLNDWDDQDGEGSEEQNEMEE